MPTWRRAGRASSHKNAMMSTTMAPETSADARSAATRALSARECDKVLRLDHVVGSSQLCEIEERLGDARGRSLRHQVQRSLQREGSVENIRGRCGHLAHRQQLDRHALTRVEFGGADRDIANGIR